MHPFLAVSATVVLTVSASVGVFVMGGILHTLLRVGKTEAQVEGLHEDVRDIKDDVRFIIRHYHGGVPPSEEKKE